ncbi:MFS transporter [uncultured Brachybacterium sp.]|uniref:MFS transporter n=1 Tax=uncultured Brachybacterium sp. TaxID=189680 RepID=UPI0026219B34|nr:MFS transporter [uncultured Brachybacterium sp.]
MAGRTAVAPVQRTPVRRPNGALLRWFVSYGSFAVPQAAAPIAFSLIALPLTGDAASGAAMMLAMTIAQVLGAVPITRLGRRFSPIPFLRVLIGLRTLALVGIAVLAGLHAPFPLVVAGAALAGLVNGAAYGNLRAVLNHLVPAGRLPRALGVAATLNEVTFVASPVLAAVLGSVSPQAAAWAMVLLGMGPMVLLPRIATATAPGPEHRASRLRLSPMIVLWLVCGGASAAAIAAIEIGAVSMAVSFGLPAAWGVLFPVAICASSIVGGIWVSVHNRMPRRRTVLAWLAVTALGVAAVGFGSSVATTVIGALLVGAVLAPLATYYSLVLDHLVAPEHRAEVFAQLRTANALGIITSSALLSLVSLQVTFTVVMALMTAVMVVAGLVFTAGWVKARRRRLAREAAEGRAHEAADSTPVLR